jgi:hypothetical protein
VLHRYSNLDHITRKLGKLTDLPERKEPDSTTSNHRMLRQPASAERELMIASYESGLTIRGVTAGTGFHPDTVSAVLRRAGVATRYHRRVTVDLDRADELIARGLTVTETAAELGIGRTTLVRARREGQSF